MTPLNECVRLACRWEAMARKVGNVHPGARFANTTVEDFYRSAEAIALERNRSFRGIVT